MGMFFSTAIQSATQEQTVVYPDGSAWVKDNVRGWIMLFPPTSGAAPLPPPDKLNTTKDAAVISGITSKTTNTAALANAQKRADSGAPVVAKNAVAAVNSANKAAVNATKASANASKAALNTSAAANKSIVVASNSAAVAATNATKAANNVAIAVAKNAPAPVVNTAAANATAAAAAANTAAANANAAAASPNTVTAARGGRRTNRNKKNGRTKRNRR